MENNPAAAEFEFDVGVNDKVSLMESFFLSIQNISVMATMMIFPGILGRTFHMESTQIAYLYGICFMICGIATIFQSVVFLRLPVVQGPWAPTFSALIVLGHLPGSDLGTAFGSFFVASLIWCVFSVPVRGVSLIGALSKYFLDPVVSGVIIVLAMVQLANATVPHWLGEPTSPGFPVLNIVAGAIAVVVLMTLMTRRNVVLRRGAVLISLLIGSVIFFTVQPAAFHAGSSPFFTVPRPFAFGFGVRPVFVVIFLMTLIPTGVQSIAMYELISTWIRQPLSVGRVSQGVFAMALAATLASVFGSFSTVFYATNLSLLQSTKVGSRYVTLATGILLVILGCFAKVDLLFAMIPGPIISAISTVLFGVVFAHGARLIFARDFDDRKCMVVGLSLFLGLGGLFVPLEVLHRLPILLQTVISQPVILGGTAIVFLYPLLCNRKQVTAGLSTRRV
ncbi:solute carrier family 23 protein [Caballeronia sp. dw_19]|uniref:uracil-xanthine permease family protein n=1 Tax=Caballeronia sp. dw_19 TaxID=2719791 RepID=UPI001BD6DB62